MNSLPATNLEAELGSLFERHSGRIFGYCLRRLPNREEAEDAVQHTFLNAYRGLRQGVVPRSETAWLFKIAENVCRERRRSAWRRSRIESAADPDGLASIAAAPERSHDELAGLADALAELPPNQQRAILLREWQGLSYREIAGELGASEAAVETVATPAVRHDLSQALMLKGAKHQSARPGSPASSTAHSSVKAPVAGAREDAVLLTGAKKLRNRPHVVQPPTSTGQPPAGTG